MTTLAPIVEQAQLYLSNHVSPELLQRTVLIPLGFLAAGVALCVLGAKLARPGLTTAFGLLGGLLGVGFARESGYSAALGGLLAAAMFATIAFLTFRLWVGMVAAVVFSAVALGAFGYQRVAPHVAEFQEVSGLSAGSHADAVFAPDAQSTHAHRGLLPEQWAQQLWTYVATKKDATVRRDVQLMGAGVGLIGLFLGVIAVRWMLILSTSVLGTILVTSGVAAVFARSIPASYQSLVHHPGLVGVGVGGFLMTSFIVQTLLTRKAPRPAEAVSGKR